MDAVRAYAPGRANLIGEHTDYNEGLCLPFALERGVTVTAGAVPERTIEARALDLGEETRLELPDAGRAERPAGRGDPWATFVHGAVGELLAAGIELRPCRLEIAGDLPRGEGLASSAALSVALCLALCGAAGADPPERVELARLCSRIENDWVGARTGLLDQLAALFGAPDRALRIDLRGPRLEPVPLALEGHRLVTLDSGAPRGLAESGYNRRRAECEATCRALGTSSLRDVREAELDRLPEPLRRRARHVLSENARVDTMVAALRERDLTEAGRLLDASHASLRDDYEVSVPAVEATVKRARSAGALGARIHGGGFGGHVLALFPPDAEPPPDALALTPGGAAGLVW